MKKLSLLMSLGTLLLSTQGFSAESSSHEWEIWFNRLADVNVNFANGPGTLSSSTTGINLLGSPNVTFGRFIAPGLEIVLSPAVVFNSGTVNSVTAYSFMAGFNYSFAPVVEDSFFVQAQAGIAGASSGTLSQSAFTWNIAAGKRFKIVDHVNFTPSVSYTSIAYTTTVATLAFAPVQFSVMF